jgi:hypothetical protein
LEEGWLEEGWLEEGWLEEGWLEEGWLEEGWLEEGWDVPRSSSATPELPFRISCWTRLTSGSNGRTSTAGLA